MPKNLLRLEVDKSCGICAQIQLFHKDHNLLPNQQTISNIYTN